MRDRSEIELDARNAKRGPDALPLQPDLTVELLLDIRELLLREDARSEDRLRRRKELPKPLIQSTGADLDSLVQKGELERVQRIVEKVDAWVNRFGEERGWKLEGGFGDLSAHEMDVVLDLAKEALAARRAK